MVDGKDSGEGGDEDCGVDDGECNGEVLHASFLPCLLIVC